MMNLFHEVSQDCSRITTEKYSTSFSSAIRLLHKDLRTIRPCYLKNLKKQLTMLLKEALV